MDICFDLRLPRFCWEKTHEMLCIRYFREGLWQELLCQVQLHSSQFSEGYGHPEIADRPPLDNMDKMKVCFEAPKNMGEITPLKNAGQAGIPMANTKSSGGGCTRFRLNFQNPGSNFRKKWSNFEEFRRENMFGRQRCGLQQTYRINFPWQTSSHTSINESCSGLFFFFGVQILGWI